jgi:hypothetical protein
MLLVLGIVIVLALLSVWIVLSVRKKTGPIYDENGKQLKTIPMAEGYLPIVGHFFYFLTYSGDKDNLLPLIQKLLTASGEAQSYQILVPGRTYIITAKPEIIRHITSTKFETVYKKGQHLYYQYLPLFGNGIFNVCHVIKIFCIIFHREKLTNHLVTFSWKIGKWRRMEAT